MSVTMVKVIGTKNTRLTKKTVVTKGVESVGFRDHGPKSGHGSR